MFSKICQTCIDFEPGIPLTWSERFATVLLSPIVRQNLKPNLPSCFLKYLPEAFKTEWADDSSALSELVVEKWCPRSQTTTVPSTLTSPRRLSPPVLYYTLTALLALYACPLNQPPRITTYFSLYRYVYYSSVQSKPVFFLKKLIEYFICKFGIDRGEKYTVET